MRTIPVSTGSDVRQVDRDDWIRYQARRRMVSPDLISDATLAAAARAYRHLVKRGIVNAARCTFAQYLRQHGLIGGHHA